MRKVLFPLFLILIFFSCKKDEYTFDLIDKSDIQGTWIEQGYKFEYFDVNNNKVFEINQDNAFIDKIEIGESTVQIFYTAGTTASTSYLLSTESNKVYFTVPGEKNEITNLTDNSMIWQLTGTNGTYLENGVRKVADHYSRTATFSK